MRLHWLAVPAMAGVLAGGCHSTTAPSNLLSVSVAASAAVVTGGTNYLVMVHVVNSGAAIDQVTGMTLAFATNTLSLGSNAPGLPFATTIPAYGSADSRAINVTDTTVSDPIATHVQVTLSFLDSSGLTKSVTATSAITLASGAVPVTPAVPAVSFDTGRYRVGIDVAAGRYFAAPPLGCYIERESALDGAAGEVLGNDFLAFASPQWIVDIASTDVGFLSSGCGTWTQTPIAGLTTTIGPGMFQVNSQIAPGNYQVAAAAGCYWERLSDFSRATSGLITNGFVPVAATTTVTIVSTDAGFDTSPECGTWTAAPATSAAPATATASLGDASTASPAATRQAYRDWLIATGRWRPHSR